MRIQNVSLIGTLLLAALVANTRFTVADPIAGAGTLPPDDPLGAARVAAVTALSRVERGLGAHFGKSGTIGGAGAELIERSVRSAIRVTYEGDWEMEAHLHHPYETTHFRTRLTLVDGGADGARLDWTAFSAKTDTVGSTETDFFLDGRVIRRGDGADPFLTYPPERVTTERFIAGSVAPWRLLAEARKDAAKLRWITVLNPPAGATDAPLGGAKLGEIESPSVGGRVGDLYFGDPEPVVRAVEVVWSHPRLGDVCDWATYNRMVAKGSVQVADSLTVRWHGADESSVMRLKLRSVQVGIDARAALTPPDAAPDAPPDPRALALSLEMNDLAPGVHAIAIPNFDVRVLAVEFDDHLVVLEAPLTSAAGEAIVDRLQRDFPKKPIRYVLFSHYHPHYTGALRAFMAAGATVVVTPGNEAFVRDIARRPFRLSPDRWAALARDRRAPELQVEVMNGTRTFTDGTQELRAIDIGAKSNHTDEYLVFALPASGLLFEGDLGYFMSNGKLAGSRRAAGMLEAVEAAGGHPTRIVQAWPVKDTPESVTREELEAVLPPAKK